MPLGFSPRSELATPLLKLILETVQLTQRTTCPIKCHTLRLRHPKPILHGLPTLVGHFNKILQHLHGLAVIDRGCTSLGTNF